MYIKFYESNSTNKVTLDIGLILNIGYKIEKSCIFKLN